MSASIPRGHLLSLDGLRGVAILFVLLFHYYNFDHHLLPAHLFWSATRAGWLGVDLFFVLSGFLITGILLDAKSQPEHYFKRFYIRRTLRIFPLYYGVLVIVFLVFRWIPAFDEPTFKALEDEQWALWLYVSNLVSAIRGTQPFVSASFEANHFWSLAAEEQFYLFWPVVVFLVRDARLLLIATVCAVLTSWAARLAIAPSVVASLVWRADGLLAGAALAAAIRDPRLRTLLIRSAPALAGAALLALSCLAAARGGLHHEDPWALRLGITLATILSLGLVIWAVSAAAASPLSRILQSRLLIFFGTYSYGLYILHWAFEPLVARYLAPILWLSAPTSVELVNGLWWTAFRIALSSAAAWLSYHLVESHFLALKDRWAPYPQNRAPKCPKERVPQ